MVFISLDNWQIEKLIPLFLCLGLSRHTFVIQGSISYTAALTGSILTVHTRGEELIWILWIYLENQPVNWDRQVDIVVMTDGRYSDLKLTDVFREIKFSLNKKPWVLLLF